MMLFTAFTFLVASAQALMHSMINHKITDQNAISLQIGAYNFTMPIDHFSDDMRTYNHRYWVNDNHYQPGGPVIFSSGGEFGVSDIDAVYNIVEIPELMTAPMELAKRLNGLVIFFEHRFYGGSMPFAVARSESSDPNTFTGNIVEGGIESYKYLTIEQSLEDVAHFARNFELPAYEPIQFAPSRTPWIWVAGSYAAMQGAWIRQRNPEIFYAVWASSAPVEVRFDNGVYHNPIYRAIPRNCSNDIQTVVQYVDKTIRKGGHQSQLLKQIFVITEAAINGVSDNVNLTLADDWSENTIGYVLDRPVSSGAQNWGPHDSTQKFCDYMEQFDPAAHVVHASDDIIASTNAIFRNPGNHKSIDGGIASEYDAHMAFAAFLYGTQKWLPEYFNRSHSDQSQGSPYRPPNMWSDGNSFAWQCISELGFWKGHQDNPMNLVSSFYNSTGERNAMAQRHFPHMQIPSHPDLVAGLKYGGWDMTPSQVMFTNGEYDPWRSLGVSSEESTINAPMRNMTQTIPACGVPPPGSDVFGLVHLGKAHCSDLAKLAEENKTAFDDALNLFMSALDIWLPCFNQTKIQQ